jgi:hypothetical protein
MSSEVQNRWKENNMKVKRQMKDLNEEKNGCKQVKQL